MIRETVSIETLGPYAGQRLSGAPEILFAARITVEYRFDDVTIRFEDIPAIVDAEHTREIVSGAVARNVNAIIAAIRQAIRRGHGGSSYVDQVRKTFIVPADDLVHAA